MKIIPNIRTGWRSMQGGRRFPACRFFVFCVIEVSRMPCYHLKRCHVLKAETLIKVFCRGVSLQNIQTDGFHSIFSGQLDGFPNQGFCIAFSGKLRMDAQCMDDHSIPARSGWQSPSSVPVCCLTGPQLLSEGLRSSAEAPVSSLFRRSARLRSSRRCCRG